METDLRRTLANLFLKAASVPVEKASRLILVVVAARALGAAAFGTYQYAVTLTALLAASTEFGLGIWTTRSVARDLEQAVAIAGTGLRLRVLAVPLYAAALGIALVLAPGGEDRRVLFLLGLAALAGSFVDYFGAIFRGHERLRDEASLNSARALLALVAGLGALQLRRSVTSLAAGLTVGALLGAAIGWRLLRSRYRLRWSSRSDLHEPVARAAAREAVPLWLAGLLATLYFRCDVVILRAFSGDAEVGHYGVAYRIFDALMLAPSLLLAATFPRLARVAGDRGRERRFQIRLALSLLLLGGLVGAATYPAADGIVRLGFGKAFIPAAASLRPLSFALAPAFLNFALTHYLIARDLERRYLVVVAGMLVLNVGLNLLVVPQMGGPGAAWATVLTEVALSLACLVALAMKAPAVGLDSVRAPSASSPELP